MKNYDVKASAIDLATRSKITVEGKRLAYLVPNMFNKIVSGFSKKMLAYMTSKSEAVENVPTVNTSTKVEPIKTEPEVPQISVVPPVVNQNVVTQTEPVVAPISAVQPVVNQNVATQTQPENNDVAKINTEINSKIKNYIIKVLQTDVDYLKSKQMRSISAPRRLLISTVFVQKLLTHRANAIQENLAKEAVSVASEPPKVEVPVDPKEAAVTKYVELMNKRKEAITIKQSCEKEMTELVNEFGITLDMVNAELAKGNMEKIG